MTIREEIELKRYSEWHKYQCSFCKEYLHPRDRAVEFLSIHKDCVKPMQIAKRLTK